MKIARVLLGAAALTMIAPVSTAVGQQSNRGVARAMEEDARASWQPVRDLSVRKTSDRPAPAALQPVQQVDYRRNSGTSRGTSVPIRPIAQQRMPQQRMRLVNQSEAPLPTPVPSSVPRQTAPRSVMESVPTPPLIRSQSNYSGNAIPLDGEVVYESMPPGEEIVYEDGYHGGGYGSGYAEGGSCGCGELGCDGMCDGSCGVSCDGGCDGYCGGGCASGFCKGNPMCGQYNDCDALAPCLTICWPHDGWLSAEYLMWWQKGMYVPPLASTDRLPSATAPINPGQLLFGGDDDVLTDRFDGVRINFGFWLDKCHTWGLGADFFQIGEESEGFNGNPTSFPSLGRPFLNSDLNGAEDIQLVNGPAGQTSTITGNLDIDVRSELSGWGVHLRHLRCANEGCDSGIFCGCPDHFCSRTEFLFGFRQTQLDEAIFARETLTAVPPDSTRFSIFDSFDTQNQFNGVEFGWLYQRTRGYWTADAGVRVGVGSTQQSVRINGQTIIDNEAAQAGGLLAQRSNIGAYEQNVFSVLPQFDAKIGYQLTDQLRATFGYTFLYWSNVVRPGDQIDRLIDPSQLPTSPAPTTPVAATFPRFAFDTTDYWAQGLSFGAEYRW